MAVDGDGNFIIQECKSSGDAGFTKNQKAAYDTQTGVMYLDGKVVGAKGKNAFGDAIIEAGSSVKIVRPE